jgi:hypothetical protein
MKKPKFDDFRESFLNCLSGITGRDAAVLAKSDWQEAGLDEARQRVLEAVKEQMNAGYGVDFEVNHRLLSVQGPVESVIIQTYHELNTIYLMERINAKIKSQMN